MLVAAQQAIVRKAGAAKAVVLLAGQAKEISLIVKSADEFGISAEPTAGDSRVIVIPWSAITSLSFEK